MENEDIEGEWLSNQKERLLLHLGETFLLIGCSFYGNLSGWTEGGRVVRL